MAGGVVCRGSLLVLLRLGLVSLVAAAMAASTVGWAGAQAPKATTPTPGGPRTGEPSRAAAAPAVAPPDELGRGTPRGAIAGFLAATGTREYERAAAYLDLGRFSASEAAQRGPTLARHLRVVLDQVLPLDPPAFSNDPHGMTDDGEPPHRDLAGRIETKKGTVDLFIARVARDDGVPIWKFSATTVAGIPALYEEFGHGPMGERLPPVFVEVRWLEIALWQWIALGLLVPVAILLAWLLVIPGVHLLRLVITRAGFALTPHLIGRMAAPLRLLVAVGLFHVARRALALAIPVQSVFLAVEKVLVVVGVAWLALRLVGVAGEKVRRSMEARSESGAIALADLT